MSVQKSPITLVDDRVTKLFTKLQMLCDELNTIGIVNMRLAPEDIVPQTTEEATMLVAYRSKRINAKRAKLSKIHSKITNSSFYDEN